MIKPTRIAAKEQSILPGLRRGEPINERVDRIVLIGENRTIQRFESFVGKPIVEMGQSYNQRGESLSFVRD
jgi:hypothetical protein